MKRSNPFRWLRGGFGFVEIAVAAVVIGVCAVPILWLVSSSRVETSKAINYLRAMELANETIEWATIIPFTDKNGNDLSRLSSGYTESLFENRLIRVGNNPAFAQVPLANDITYSDQYDAAYFYREVKITDVPEMSLRGFLKKVTVTISWNEGKTPPPNHLVNPSERMRKLTLSTLIFNDRKVEY